MVGHQRPGIAGRVSAGENITESFEKLIAVAVITKYSATVDSSDDDVVCRTRPGASMRALRGIAFGYHWKITPSTYLYIYGRPL